MEHLKAASVPSAVSAKVSLSTLTHAYWFGAHDSPLSLWKPFGFKRCIDYYVCLNAALSSKLKLQIKRCSSTTCQADQGFEKLVVSDEVKWRLACCWLMAVNFIHQKMGGGWKHLKWKLHHGAPEGSISSFSSVCPWACLTRELCVCRLA